MFHANFNLPSALYFAVVLRLKSNELRPVQILINSRQKTIMIAYDRVYRATVPNVQGTDITDNVSACVSNTQKRRNLSDLPK